MDKILIYKIEVYVIDNNGHDYPIDDIKHKIEVAMGQGASFCHDVIFDKCQKGYVQKDLDIGEEVLMKDCKEGLK